MKDEIVEGGIFSLEASSGSYFTFRRDGANPHWGFSNMMINEIRIYEVRNLLKDYDGRVTISRDTSYGLSGFEAKNLLSNLEHRSCGNGLKAI